MQTRHAVLRFANIVTAAALASCAGVGPVMFVSVTGPSESTGLIVVLAEGGAPKASAACPVPAEWDLVTWPEIEPVLAAVLEGRPFSNGAPCSSSPTRH